MAEDYLIDVCIPRLNKKTGEHDTFWRVYFWAERPDKEEHGDDDQCHWHPDSEHSSLAAAEERMAALKDGAERKSILVRTPRLTVVS